MTDTCPLCNIGHVDDLNVHLKDKHAEHGKRVRKYWCFHCKQFIGKNKWRNHTRTQKHLQGQLQSNILEIMRREVANELQSSQSCTVVNDYDPDHPQTYTVEAMAQADTVSLTTSKATDSMDPPRRDHHSETLRSLREQELSAEKLPSLIETEKPFELSDESMEENFRKEAGETLSFRDRTLVEGYGSRTPKRALSFTERELLRIFRQGPFMTEKTFGELMTLMKDPRFANEGVPNSMTGLKRLERLGVPFANLYQTLQDGDKPVYFYDMLDVLGMVFSADSGLYERGKFRYDYNRGVIEHPVNSEGAKEFARYQRALEKVTKQNYDWNLLINIFVDEYDRASTQKRKSWVISCTPANLSKEDYLKMKNKYVLAIVPHDANLDQALAEVVVKPIRRLEQGTRLNIRGKEIRVCGGLHQILGDHPGQCKVLQLIGIGSDYPDRFRVVHKEHLDCTHFSDNIPPLRDALRTFELLHQLVTPASGTLGKGKNSRGKKRKLETASAATKELQLQGLRPEISSLWTLVWSRSNLFRRVGLCYLHLELHGLWTRHTLYLLSMLSKETRDAINTEVIRLSQTFPRLRALRRGIVVEYKSKRSKKNVLKLRNRTAEELEHWVMISPFCLIKHISEEQFKLWMLHMNADRALWVESFTHKDAETVQLLSDLWREQWKKQLAKDQNAMQCDFIFSEPEAKKKTQKFGGDILNYFQGMTACFPNFCSANNWYSNLTFGGPTCFSNTKTFEAKIRVLKNLAKVTNQHNPERDVLVREGVRLGLALLASQDEDPHEEGEDGADSNEETERAEKKENDDSDESDADSPEDNVPLHGHRRDLTPYGRAIKHPTKIPPNRRKELMTLLQAERIAQVPWSWRPCKGIYFGGKQLPIQGPQRKGASARCPHFWGLAERDESVGALNDRDRLSRCYGVKVLRFAGVYRLSWKGEILPIADMHVLCPDSYVDPELQCPVLRDAGRKLVLLSHPAHIVLRAIQLLPHPHDSSNKSLWVWNKFLRCDIGPIMPPQPESKRSTDTVSFFEPTTRMNIDEGEDSVVGANVVENEVRKGQSRALISVALTVLLQVT